jgi:hypothetical protein
MILCHCPLAYTNIEEDDTERARRCRIRERTPYRGNKGDTHLRRVDSLSRWRYPPSRSPGAGSAAANSSTSISKSAVAVEEVEGAAEAEVEEEEGREAA